MGPKGARSVALNKEGSREQGKRNLGAGNRKFGKGSREQPKIGKWSKEQWKLSGCKRKN